MFFHMNEVRRAAEHGFFPPPLAARDRVSFVPLSHDCRAFLASKVGSIGIPDLRANGDAISTLLQQFNMVNYLKYLTCLLALRFLLFCNDL